MFSTKLVFSSIEPLNVLETSTFSRKALNEQNVYQSDLDPSPEEMLLLFGETVHWSPGPLFVREDCTASHKPFDDQEIFTL